MKQLTQKQIETAKKIGKLWENHGKSRVYFNSLEDRIGLKCTKYKTGNISSATINGEKISNCSAGKLKGKLYDAKVWVDTVTGEFDHKGGIDEYFEKIVNGIIEDVENYVEPEPVKNYTNTDMTEAYKDGKVSKREIQLFLEAGLEINDEWKTGQDVINFICSATKDQIQKKYAELDGDKYFKK